MDNTYYKEQIDNTLKKLELLIFSDIQEALKIGHKALETAKNIHYGEAEAILYERIGFCYGNIAEYEKGMEYLLKSLDLLPIYNLDLYIYHAYNCLGDIFFYLSDYETAFDYYSKCLQSAKKSKYLNIICIAYNNIGEIYKNLKAYDKAIKYYKNSIKTDLEINYIGSKGAAFLNLGEVYYLLGDYDKALDLVLISQKYSKNYKTVQCESNKLLALIYWKYNHDNEAYAYFNKALQLSDEAFAYYYKINILIEFHSFLEEKGKLSESIEQLNTAYNLAIKTNILECTSTICLHLAKIYERMDNNSLAIKYYKLYVKHNEQYENDMIKNRLNNIKLRIAAYKIKTQSENDVLTGIPNRRKFIKFTTKHIKLANLNKTKLSLIIFDIDCFKEYNDNYGHVQGDRCIAQIATVISESLEKNYFAARYGGDEFIIVMPNTKLDTAAEYAEQLRKMVENLKIIHAFSSTSNYVSITLGIASIIPDENTSVDDLIKIADKALYKAKKEGKNRASSI